jgi:hypothetical protein
VTDPDESAFYRAFLAMTFLVDGEGIRNVTVPSAAHELRHELESSDRQVRAAVLARELAHVAASLEARRLS